MTRLSARDIIYTQGYFSYQVKFPCGYIFILKKGGQKTMNIQTDGLMELVYTIAKLISEFDIKSLDFGMLEQIQAAFWPLISGVLEWCSDFLKNMGIFM